jgi:hypothetical protein
MRSASGIGDHCLVGTFKVQSARIHLTIKGTSVTLRGGKGIEDRYSAAGKNHVDFTGSAPIKGKYKGRTVKVSLSGSEENSAHANAAKTKLISGRATSAHGIVTKATVGSDTNTSTSHHSAGSKQPYTCTSHELTQRASGAISGTLKERRVSDRP